MSKSTSAQSISKEAVKEGEIPGATFADATSARGQPLKGPLATARPRPGELDPVHKTLKVSSLRPLMKDVLPAELLRLLTRALGQGHVQAAQLCLQVEDTLLHFLHPAAMCTIRMVSLGLQHPLFADPHCAVQELQFKLSSLEERFATLQAQCADQREFPAQQEATRREMAELRTSMRHGDAAIKQAKEVANAAIAKVLDTSAESDKLRAQVKTLEAQVGALQAAINANTAAVEASVAKGMLKELLAQGKDTSKQLDRLERKQRERPRSPSPARSSKNRVTIAEPALEPAKEPTPPPVPLTAEQENERLKAEIERLKAAPTSAAAGSSEVRGPRIPQPQPFKGEKHDDVENRLFVFENWLKANNIPPANWPNYIMPLLQDKALTAWTNVAVPATANDQPITWDMFKQTMVTTFAHPDRQFQARAALHQIRQQHNQSMADYVRHFQSLVVKAGAPEPAQRDLIMFFQNGLHTSIKNQPSAIMNPLTGQKWTDVNALQTHLITLQIHGAHKTPDLVPKSSSASVRHKSPRKYSGTRINMMQGRRPAKGGGHRKPSPAPGGKPNRPSDWKNNPTDDPVVIAQRQVKAAQDKAAAAERALLKVQAEKRGQGN